MTSVLQQFVTVWWEPGILIVPSKKDFFFFAKWSVYVTTSSFLAVFYWLSSTCEFNPSHFIRKCQCKNFDQKTICLAQSAADPSARTQGIVLESVEYRQSGFISRLFPAIVIWSEGKITDYCQMTHYCYCFIVGPGVVRVTGEPCRQR